MLASFKFTSALEETKPNSLLHRIGWSLVVERKHLSSFEFVLLPRTWSILTPFAVYILSQSSSRDASCQTNNFLFLSQPPIHPRKLVVSRMLYRLRNPFSKVRDIPCPGPVATYWLTSHQDSLNFSNCVSAGFLVTRLFTGDRYSPRSTLPVGQFAPPSFSYYFRINRRLS